MKMTPEMIELAEQIMARKEKLENTLAVVNCKSRKNDVTCSARDMYWPSKMFRTMVTTFDEIYPKFVILSAKHFVLDPITIIDPYCVSVDNHSFNKNQDHKLSKEEKQQWVDNIVNDSIWDDYEYVHLHIGLSYWQLLKPHWKTNTKFIHIGQPRTPALVIQRYEQFLTTFNNTGIIDLKSIGKHYPSKYPEVRKNWYHPLHKDGFFGYARDLVKQFPDHNLDEGTLVRVDKKNDEGQHFNSVKQHKGWCCDELTLSLLKYDDIKKQWRITK